MLQVLHIIFNTNISKTFSKNLSSSFLVRTQAQKEQYLNYRRVYQGDNQDVFSARRKLAERQSRSREESRGPQPFTQFPGMALVMATALQSAQKPAGEKSLKLSNNTSLFIYVAILQGCKWVRKNLETCFNKRSGQAPLGYMTV